MKEKEFEKLFPSIVKSEDKIWILHHELGFVINEKGLIKYCIDKKKVLEAIDNKLKIDKTYKKTVKNVLEELKKELGLK